MKEGSIVNRDELSWHCLWHYGPNVTILGLNLIDGGIPHPILQAVGRRFLYISKGCGCFMELIGLNPKLVVFQPQEALGRVFPIRIEMFKYAFDIMVLIWGYCVWTWKIMVFPTQKVMGPWLGLNWGLNTRISCIYQRCVDSCDMDLIWPHEAQNLKMCGISNPTSHGHGIPYMYQEGCLSHHEPNMAVQGLNL